MEHSEGGRRTVTRLAALAEAAVAPPWRAERARYGVVVESEQRDEFGALPVIGGGLETDLATATFIAAAHPGRIALLLTLLEAVREWGKARLSADPEREPSARRVMWEALIACNSDPLLAYQPPGTNAPLQPTTQPDVIPNVGKP